MLPPYTSRLTPGPPIVPVNEPCVAPFSRKFRVAVEAFVTVPPPLSVLT